MKAKLSIGIALSILFTNIASAAPLTLMQCEDVEIMRPQKLESNDYDIDSKLQPVRVPNPAKCDRGVLLDVGSAKLWRCRVVTPESAEYDEKQWEQAIIIEAPTNRILAYRSELMAGAYDRFLVTRADLDADGAKENILATWDSQGNGMGVHTWTLRIFSDNWQPISQAYEAKDWGPSAIVKAPNGKGCQIAITTWVEDKSRRVAGGALQANFIALINGEIKPSNDMPILRRRYTFNFQKQRLDTFNSPVGNYEGDPAKWLAQSSYRYNGR